jgi:hypothetical protein
METSTSGQALSTIGAFGYVFLGVLLSIFIPILRQLAALPAGAKGPGQPNWFERAWPVAKPYVVMAVLSLALSVVTVAIGKSQSMAMQYWYQAFLLGYFFDSTIQKFKP